MIAAAHAYHGNSMAVSKFSRTDPPPGGAWGNVRFVPAPDSYRPPITYFGWIVPRMGEAGLKPAMPGSSPSPPPLPKLG